jgi:hypothetical protein
MENKGISIDTRTVLNDDKAYRAAFLQDNGHKVVADMSRMELEDFVRLLELPIVLLKLDTTTLCNIVTNWELKSDAINVARTIFWGNSNGTGLITLTFGHDMLETEVPDLTDFVAEFNSSTFNPDDIVWLDNRRLKLQFTDNEILTPVVLTYTPTDHRIQDTYNIPLRAFETLGVDEQP